MKPTAEEWFAALKWAIEKGYIDTTKKPEIIPKMGNKQLTVTFTLK